MSIYQSGKLIIGSLELGGGAPVRIQSMTNTDTNDVQATSEQAKRIFDAGGELVRITTPGMKEAEHFIEIKRLLHEEGYDFPLIADVHFSSRVAEYMAQNAEKIRINPGNYADKKAFRKFDYSPDEYQAELTRVQERIRPLLAACKKNNTALRIGANHGSLSDRIISYFGNTPEGMAESVMEFLRMAARESFFNIVVSMKASDTRVMVSATKILAEKMRQESFSFPFHLGVTEAGSGEEARIKSALGIGALLMEGIGDTIRVSLTELPEEEIPVARKIVECFSGIRRYDDGGFKPYSLIQNQKRKIYIVSSGRDSTAADLIFDDNTNSMYSCKPDESFGKKGLTVTFVKQLDDLISLNEKVEKQALVIDQNNVHTVQLILDALHKMEMKPGLIILKRSYTDNLDYFQVKIAGEVGVFLMDDLLDGIWIENDHLTKDMVDNTILTLLQATGSRVSRAAFIACPTCGRTKFNITGRLKEVKEKTGHLKGLKIAVMGCIVNGPGEMAGADYGYVGAGPGLVTLYKGRQMIRKNIPEEEASDALVDLIKAHNDWIEPENEK